jgi:phosphatidylserine/phosphatidylglycerophosphate/cardiolipin synthase-like enzyme
MKKQKNNMSSGSVSGWKRLKLHAGAVRRRAVTILVTLLPVVLIAGSFLGCSAQKSGTSTVSKTEMSSATLITLPDDGYQKVYDFIGSAQKSIDMTMYALIDSDAEAALIAAAQRGVAVRVLLNSNASDGGTVGMNQPAYDNLTANGVQVVYAWSGVLWHQKSIVVDGEKVAIMNCNLVAQYYPILRDFIVITDNKATVAGVETTFQADFTNNMVAPVTGSVPSGSDLVWSPGAEKQLKELIETARADTTLYVETEQLDSPVLEEALIAAVKRGVTVDFTMTNTADFTAGFNTLKAGGVNVHLYPADASLYIQSKAISVNGDTVYLGSTNFTTTSTDDDRNVGIITTDSEIVKAVTATLAGDFQGAQPY